MGNSDTGLDSEPPRRTWQIHEDLGDGPSPGTARFPPVGSGRETSCWQDAPAMELPLNSHPLSSLGREGSTRPSWPRRSPGPRGAPRSRWPCGPPWRRWRQGKRDLEKPPPRRGPRMAQLGPHLQVGAGRGSFQTKGRRHCGGSGDRDPVLCIRHSLRYRMVLE